MHGRPRRTMLRPIGLSACVVALSTALAAAGDPAVIHVDRCRIRFRNHVQLAAERSGVLAQVASLGQSVKQGRIVARLRDERLAKSLAIAELEASNDVETRYARKKADLARAKYVRALTANRQSPGTVPELEISELRLAAEQSLLQIELAEHQHAVSRLRRDEQAAELATARITAPFDATVVDVFGQPGEVVREGEPILEIADTAVFRVHAAVPLDAAGRIAADDAIRVTVPLVGRDGRRREETFPGRVTHVGVKLEPVSNTVAIRAEIVDGRGRLRDGMSGTLAIHVDRDAASVTRSRSGRTPAPVHSVLGN